MEDTIMPDIEESNIAPTIYAEKYGQMPGTHHSAYTPIVPFFATPANPTQDPVLEMLEEEQRQKCFGFTAHELINIGANITVKDSLKPGNLTNDILPCFDKQHWNGPSERYIPRELDPQLGGGQWLAANPIIWDVLQPVLRLVTRLVSEWPSAPFFHALIAGKRINIEASRLPAVLPDIGMKEFRAIWPPPNSNDPSQFSRHQKLVEWLIERIKGHVRFQFKPLGETRTYNGVTRTQTGVRSTGDEYPSMIIELDTRLYETLLRENITDAEKLAYQWRVAMTLTHECCHAVEKITRWVEDNRAQKPLKYTFKHESFWQDDPIAEAGFQMEQYVFGSIHNNGELYPLSANKKPFPYLSIAWTEWPSPTFRGYGERTIFLNSPPFKSSYMTYPIHISHYQDAQQSDFWDLAIKKFGPNVLQLRTPSVGRQATYTSFEPDQVTGKKIIYSDGPFAWHWMYKDLNSKLNMEPDELQACVIGGDLIEQAKRIESYWDASAKEDFLRRRVIAFNKKLAERLAQQAQQAKQAQTPLVEGQVQPTVPISTPQEDTVLRNQIVLQNQCKLIQQLVQAHADTVDSFQDLLHAGKASKSQRERLSAFNRGLRGFCRHITQTWTGALKSIGADVDIHLRLEWSRQKVFWPTDTDFTAEHKELTELYKLIDFYKNIETNPTESGNGINAIAQAFSQDYEASMFVRDCSSVIVILADISQPRVTIHSKPGTRSLKDCMHHLALMGEGKNNAHSSEWYLTFEDVRVRLETWIVARKAVPSQQQDPMES